MHKVELHLHLIDVSAILHGKVRLSEVWLAFLLANIELFALVLLHLHVSVTVLLIGLRTLSL